MNRTKQREVVLWRGRPSSFLNAPQYFYGAVFAALLMPADLRIGLIPFAICIWYWLNTRSERYELTDTRLITYSGVLTKRVEKIMLRDIKDFDVLQSWFFRLLSLSTVILIVDEFSDSQPCILCISDADQLIERIRKLASASET